MPFAFVPITIAALAGTGPAGRPRIGVVQHVAADRGRRGYRAPLDDRVSTTDELARRRHQQPVALTDGFGTRSGRERRVALIGVLVSVFLVRGRDLQPVGEPAPEVALEAA